MPDVAIAHKDYDVRGGGEVLAEHLAQDFDAPLFVGHRDPENVSEADGLDVREIPLTRWQRAFINRGGAPRSLAYMFAWQCVPALADYDTVILSGNEAAWYVPTDTQTVVAYIHSPPRYQYDLFQESEPGLVGTVYGMAVRTIFQHNLTRPDYWVANSDLVARRMNRYWDVPYDRMEVVYPPVDVDNYDRRLAPTEDYYLHLGRLASNKRIEMAVEAFSSFHPEETLLVAGRGPERDRLEAMAGDNVEFLGYVSEERKRELLSGAKALVYPPINEDFGMVPIEAMASGTPVIGVADGFTQYQVRDGDNGILFEAGTENLADAVDAFETEGVAWQPERIERYAEQFAPEQFEAGMRRAVAAARDRATVDPSINVPAPVIQ